MDEIIKALSSPLWWLTAMGAGVIASLFSAYLKPATDRLLSRISSRARRALIRQRATRESRIEALSADDVELTLEACRQVEFAVVISILMGLLIVVIVATPLGMPRNSVVFVAAVILPTLLIFLTAGSQMNGEYREARERRRKARQAGIGQQL